MEKNAPRRAAGRARVTGWALMVVAVIAVVVVAVALGRPAAPQPGQPSNTPATQPASTPGSASPEPAPSPSRTPEPPVSGPFTSPPRAEPSEKGAPPELEPVDPDQAVEGVDGMRVALTEIESVAGEAVQAGEISGPAIRVHVTITNGTGQEFDTNTVVVNAYFGPGRTPAGTLVKPGGVPFLGRLAPGESTYGIYLFGVPPDQRKDVTITVDYQAATPAVVFHGDVN